MKTYKLVFSKDYNISIQVESDKGFSFAGFIHAFSKDENKKVTINMQKVLYFYEIDSEPIKTPIYKS